MTDTPSSQQPDVECGTKHKRGWMASLLQRKPAAPVLPSHDEVDDQADYRYPHSGSTAITPPSAQQYSAAGGGEASVTSFSPVSLLHSFYGYLAEESSRPTRDPVAVKGPDLHQRLPAWMETKDVNIKGEPLTEEEKASPQRWRGKYRRELDIADAIVRVKSQKIVEVDHNVIGMYHRVRRWVGWEPPLSEAYARKMAEAKWQALDEREAAAVNSNHGSGGAGGKAGVATGSGALIQGGSSASHSRASSAWNVFMIAAETGRPLVHVAEEYRPQVDFYGLDAFVDHPMSFIWFWTKIGMFMGLVQGTARAANAITADVRYLRASGVGVLSVLNLSVFAGVVKWGGNSALLSSAFCIGDGLVSATRQALVPSHEVRASKRTTWNYVGGLGCAGSTVGIMPWWILNDSALAMRLSVTGFCVGGSLGVLVGLLLKRVVSMNLSRLDTTPRQLRRYEALLLRQRQWTEAEVKACKKCAPVWW